MFARFRALSKRSKTTLERYFSGLSDENWTAPWAVHARRNLFSRLHHLRKSKAKPEEVLFVVSECRRRELLRDPRDWVVAMSSLGHVQLWTETLGLLEAMYSEMGFVAVQAFNATISATEKAQQWQHAIALFSDIERYSLSPDAVTCNALLSACDKGGKWESALDLLQRAGHFQLQPNVVSYSATVSACERARAWEQALQVFASMHARQIAGDVVAFNAALCALDRGSQWQEALMMLEDMSQMRLKRSLASYGAVISACGDAFQWEESIELLSLLQKQLLQPNLIVMNLCLNASRKANNLHVSLKLYNDMLSRSDRPDLLSYTSLISACTFGAEWQLALQLHEDAQFVTGKLDILSFNALLGVCRQASRWEEAHRILHDLKGYGLSPTVPTYKAVISACARATRWSDAVGHLSSLMKTLDTPTTPGSGNPSSNSSDFILQYGIVSKACVEAGFGSVGQALLAEAEHMASARGLVSGFPAEWLSVLHWQAALWAFETQKAMHDLDDGVRVVGVADVLIEAGRDAGAMSLLIDAQEAGNMSLWRCERRKVLDLHDLGGRGSCSAPVAEAAVSAALLQMAHDHNFSAKHSLVIVTGRGRRSIRGIPLLLPAMMSFLVDGLGLEVRQDPGSLRVSRASLHRLWQGERWDTKMS